MMGKAASAQQAHSRAVSILRMNLIDVEGRAGLMADCATLAECRRIGEEMRCSVLSYMATRARCGGGAIGINPALGIHRVVQPDGQVCLRTVHMTRGAVGQTDY